MPSREKKKVFTKKRTRVVISRGIWGARGGGCQVGGDKGRFDFVERKEEDRVYEEKREGRLTVP